MFLVFFQDRNRQIWRNDTKYEVRASMGSSVQKRSYVSFLSLFAQIIFFGSCSWVLVALVGSEQKSISSLPKRTAI